MNKLSTLHQQPAETPVPTSTQGRQGLSGGGSEAVFEIFDNRRQQGKNDDTENKKLEIFLNEGKLAEKISAVAEQAHPQERPHNIEKNESGIGHRSDSRHKGSKSPDNGDEAGDNDGFAAVLLEKGVRFFKMVRVEKARLPEIEHLRTELVPDCVVHAVTKHGGNEKDQKKQMRIELRTGYRGKRTGGKEQGITRKKRGYDQAGFAENNQEQDAVKP